jgi:hypothetical protein
MSGDTANMPTGLAFDPLSSNLYMIYDSYEGGTGGAYVFSDTNGVFDPAQGIYITGGFIDDPAAIAVVVPEPSSFLLAGLALLPIALFQVRRMRKNRATESVRG